MDQKLSEPAMRMIVDSGTPAILLHKRAA